MTIVLGSVLVAALPSMAHAAEGDHVHLKFDGLNQVLLFVSLFLGIVAIAYGIFLSRSVLAQSPGDERMQDVGKAIRDGAVAYLRQQISTMALFVLLLAIGLLALYFRYGMMTAVGVALAFVAGVVGSYVAGSVGMMIAVNGNMRTANAALTSYRKSLEIAFKSGAVAGLMTVGIGLVGATLILLFGGAGAIKYLVGFGFGGSLAALFMRVGGGIFTKAADVGADLVGKVEAGIPEDDPRNPATIADNVGDNVGDCAGMAADVFESYIVLLIAAIVLAASTSAVLGGADWMRLVVFAMLTAGVGALASVIGIAVVRGSDDPDMDPLVPIRRGFLTTSALAAFFAFGGGYFILGNRAVEVAQLQTTRDEYRADVQFFRKLQEEVATRKPTESQVEAARKAKAESLKKDPSDVTAAELYADPTDVPESLRGISQAAVERFLKKDNAPVEPYEVTSVDLAVTPAAKEHGFVAEDASRIQELLRVTRSQLAERPDMNGYSKVDDLRSTDIKALDYAMTVRSDSPNFNVNKPYTTVREFFKHNAVGSLVDSLRDQELEPLKGDKLTEALARIPRGLDPELDTKLADYADKKLNAEALRDYILERGKQAIVVAEVHIKATIPETPAQNGMPAMPGRSIDRTLFQGPVTRADLDQQVTQTKEQAKAQKIEASVEVVDTYPVSLFYNATADEFALGIPEEVDRPYQLESGLASFGYFRKPASEANQAYDRAQQSQTVAPMPPLTEMSLGVVTGAPIPWYLFPTAVVLGILLAFAIERLTEYYVSTHMRPTQEVAGVSSGGAASMLIQGFAFACESSAVMVIAIVAALLLPLFLFPAALGGYIMGLYGIALVGLGLLTTTGYVLAMDTFGPISDNAQGVFEMAGKAEEHPEAAKAVGRLDAAGNTTKALTKGFAIATAVVAAIALFNSFRGEAMLMEVGLKLDVPEIFLGLLIGGAAPFMFSSFAISAVGRSSFQLINEVRRQFRENPGIMTGETRPDYARCVAIVTQAAQKELIAPGVLAIALPIAVAFGFAIGKEPVNIGGQEYVLTGAQALGGFLAGAILSGQLMAVLLANSGGMWDNAKKLIEDGLYGGKGSEAHKAAVTCDTLGDPFKDTAGPALNPLIKVMNLVALLLAPAIIVPMPAAVTATITIISVILLVVVFLLGKRGSLSEELNRATSAGAAADAHFSSGTVEPLSAPLNKPNGDVIQPEAPKAKRRITVEDDDA
jgi:K(+)-stimulated pyrophosphate-energized sodium pump